MAYKGAKYIGQSEIILADGQVIRNGDIIDMPELEAKARRQFEVVYEKVEKKPVYKKNEECDYEQKI